MAQRGVNKVILVGNLGVDPEVRQTSSGGTVTNFRIATSESWKDQQGEQQERTEWHRVVIWGKLADIAATYLKKGSKVYLEGRLQTRKWQDKDGKDQYTVEVVANELQMLDRADNGNSNDENRPIAEPSRTQTRTPTRTLRPAQPAMANDDPDDDIPF